MFTFRKMFSTTKSNINDLVMASMKQVFEEATRDSKNLVQLQNQISTLTEERRTLKDELADIRKQKELEKIEIEHLVALKEERLKLQIDQKEVALEKIFQAKELELRKQAYDDMVKRIEKAGNDMKEIYTEIMNRLPNVNVKMKKDL
jgi:hypothetical protein